MSINVSIHIISSSELLKICSLRNHLGKFVKNGDLESLFKMQILILKGAESDFSQNPELTHGGSFSTD